jgi:diguanylate cyclase
MDAVAHASSPANIAREAIRRLAASRVAPTPENFARAYYKAAGIENDGDPSIAEPEQVLSLLVRGIFKHCPEQASAAQLQEFVKVRAWKNALKVVNDVVGQAMADPPQEWPRVLLQLLNQLDTTHTHWTRARKLGALRRVLGGTGSETRTREKLERLMAGWAEGAENHTGLVDPADDEPVNGTAANVGARLPVTEPMTESGTCHAAGDPSAAVRAWRLLALTALECYQPALDADGTSAAPEPALMARLAKVSDVPGEVWVAEVRSAGDHLKSEVSRQGELRQRLIKLLRLLCENMALFAEDDAWVHGQVTRIMHMLEAPLDESALSEVEDSLCLAIQRQAEIKSQIKQAKAAVKEMLSSLIDHLAHAASSTGEFHERISYRAEEIKQADDLASLSLVVAELLDDTVDMRKSIQRTHDEMMVAREGAMQHEARVQALERELVDVSSLVRLDPLTQVLNRRGLEEAFAVEQARAERENIPLSVVLLDIDNFKCLNDSLGHQAGDRALVHVANLVRGSLRPSDKVARYGGEEFVILLPATTIADAAAILTRTQRQLTRTIFLHDDEKILITFSAGVTQYRHGDTYGAVVHRADDAVYAAKAAGKNRVQTA